MAGSAYAEWSEMMYFVPQYSAYRIKSKRDVALRSLYTDKVRFIATLEAPIGTTLAAFIND